MIYISRYYNLNNIVLIIYNKSYNRIMKKKRKFLMLLEEVNMNIKNLKWNFCNFSLCFVIVLDVFIMY